MTTQLSDSEKDAYLMMRKHLRHGATIKATNTACDILEEKPDGTIECGIHIQYPETEPAPYRFRKFEDFAEHVKTTGGYWLGDICEEEYLRKKWDAAQDIFNQENK